MLLLTIVSSTACYIFRARSSRSYGNDRSGRNTHSIGVLPLEGDTRDAFSNSHGHAGNGDHTLARKQEL